MFPCAAVVAAGGCTGLLLPWPCLGLHAGSSGTGQQRRVNSPDLLFRMSLTPLKKVGPEHSCWEVKVWVTRFYDQFDQKDPPNIIRFEFVMLDEEYGTMEAVMPLKWIKKHRASLIEDRVYRLRYLEIVDARNSHRPVPHPFMTRLTGHTQIVEVTQVPQSFPLYACSVAPFATLRARSDDRDDMSDCIGIFTKCSQVMNQKTRFGDKTLLNVHITDGRETAVLSLWGPHATKFEVESESMIQLASKAPVVLLFVGVIVKIFNNRLALQCSSVCRWYINPLLPEKNIAAAELRCRS
ncbi:hypothetical protein PVAP13_5NG038600 [Panicum virgatum]|uniref:Replication protein A 70 kDa DNA-binding subunit B/D first OB fold domain-containing protein n=1 Tax=Panicum virgatum TaxID=38727 RepID=A0A8T0RPE0_PANVG|nr:hypothetical protein PVAP13_5NG038600 [Panicum virgatum]